MMEEPFFMVEQFATSKFSESADICLLTKIRIPEAMRHRSLRQRNLQFVANAVKTFPLRPRMLEARLHVDVVALLTCRD